MRVNRFSFNLQLFGEDVSDLESSEVAAQAESDYSEANDNNNTEVEQNNSDLPQYGVAVDPNTGRRSVKEIEKQPENNVDDSITNDSIEENKSNEDNQEQQQNGIMQQVINQQPHIYSEQEFGLALQMGNVDDSRIPEGYREQYNRYKEQKLNNLSQENSIDVVKQRKDFYNQIDKVARNITLQELGLTEADITPEDEYDENLETKKNIADFNTALMFNKNRLIANIQENQIVTMKQQQQQATIYSDIRSFVDNAASNEPNFKQIDDMLMKRYKQLPYEEGQKVASAVDSLHGGTITPEQCQILQKYYEDTRREFYARSNKLSTKPMMVRPPVVEGSGTGASEPQSFDFGKMRNMDRRSRQKFIADYFNQHKQ